MAGRWSTVLGAARGGAKLGRGALQSYLAARAARGGGMASSGGGGGKRRRGKGITASDFKTTHRTMRKIIKLYNKLPKRPGSKFGGGGFKGGFKR